MLDPLFIVRAMESAGFTHLVWIPDSHLGTWNEALVSSRLNVVRPTREGEAIAIAAGLILGGARPLVAIQCTGFFEAGDAVRNVVHDLGLPLKLIVGVRSWRTSRAGKSKDNCPRYTEPLVKAWDLPCGWFDPAEPDAAAESSLRNLMDATGPYALLWAE